MDENYQLTDDPAALGKIERLKTEFSGGQSATVEMHSGITYRGRVSGQYFGRRSATGQPERAGGYLLMDANGARIRLDALDIKSWTVGA